MGTWGYKTFQNDAASDWLYDLEEAKEANFLLKPLQAVNRSRGKPDIDDCLESLAAADVIAGSRSEPPKGIPSIANKWVRRVGLSPNNVMVNLALRAVGRVKKDSELADTWKEAGKLTEWSNAVEQLLCRLEQALKVPAPKRAAKQVTRRQTLAEFIIEVAANPIQGQREALRKKLANLSNPNRPVGGKGLNSMTPLHWVAAHGLLEEAKLLVSRGALIDAEVACMAKPIVFALDNKHYDMIDFLIKAGADKDYALLNAIRNNEVGVAKKLADAGANLMSKNEGNVTLLHFAAMAGATKSIKWLLDQGLDINAIDCTGGTPLFDAITKPSLEGVKILVEHGADLHIKNNKGETPIDLAKLEFVPKTITRFIQQHI